MQQRRVTDGEFCDWNVLIWSTWWKFA